MMKPEIPDAWWANFARFVTPNKFDDLASISADAVTTVGHDEGIGALTRENFMDPITKNWLDGLQSIDVKAMAWLELMGEARTHIGAVIETAPGVFEKDPDTGRTKMTSYYIWDQEGVGVQSVFNKIVWFGAHSWANREAYYGDLGMPADFMASTYPNGNSALGV